MLGILQNSCNQWMAATIRSIAISEKQETSAYDTFGKTISNSGFFTPHHLNKAIKKIQ